MKLVKLDMKEALVNIVSAYVRQAGCSLEDKVDFWQLLNGAMQQISAEEQVLVLGDLIEHLGTARTGYEHIHSGYAIGNHNQEGEDVLAFTLAYDMAITNTYFKKKDEHLATYSSSGIKTQIDFCLVRHTQLSLVTNAKVIPGEAIMPQHQLLVICLKLRAPMKPTRLMEASQIKWRTLKTPGYKSELACLITSNLTDPAGPVNGIWAEMAQTITTHATTLLGTTKGGKKPNKESWWWSEEIWDTVRQKKVAYKEWQRSRLDDNYRAYRAAKTNTKAAVAKARHKACNNLYKQLNTQEGAAAIYRIARARKRATEDITIVKTIKDCNGKPLQDNKEVKERWSEYFSSLLNAKNKRAQCPPVLPTAGPIPLIREEEVEKALKKMHTSKAPGPDEIPVEAWKACGQVAIKWLTAYFNEILKQGKMPDAWRRSEIVPIYNQKGNVQACENYRGIKLLPHTMKLFEWIINARLRDITEIAANQFGFMPGRSTTDAIFALRILTEKFREKKQQLHLTFLDMEKAYDRVPRKLIWWALRKKNVPEAYIRIIQDMYAAAETTVRTPCGQTAAFPVAVGVHQGSALSPLLFILVLDAVCEGLPSEAPWTMLYADNVAICAKTREELEERVSEWKTRLEKNGLRLYLKKTEYMAATDKSGNRDKNLSVDGQQVSQTSRFKYLGSVIAREGGAEEDVKARTASGWLKWRATSGVLCDPRMPRWLKGKVYRSVVRPALLYGCECWATTKKDEQRMKTTEMRMLCWMCGLTRLDRVQNEVVRRMVGMAEITDKMQEGPIWWFGHVTCRPENYIRNVTQKIKVEGRRPRGRPKK
uniref:Reverse transcriptase domain-containing protein n=1 Tax=Plectus sambesii TaxID=2011161 RepID=A0A914WJ69_9BILA